MLKTFEAIKQLLSLTERLSSENIDLLYANNRVLSCDLKSKTINPPQNLSAMDGFAIKKEDKIKFNKLKIIGERRLFSIKSMYSSFSGLILTWRIVQMLSILSLSAFCSRRYYFSFHKSPH